MKKTRQGFTIVELLIVIVVIGILAAIVIVAYNGVQTRAKNTQVISTVKVYYQALLSYGADKGGFPATASGCLGEGYADGQCWTGTNGTRPSDTALNNAIRPYMGNKSALPITDKSQFTGAGDVRGGVVFTKDTSRTLDGAPFVYALEYYITGQQCGYGQIVRSTGGNTFTPSTTGATSFSAAYNLSQCIIYVPAP